MILLVRLGGIGIVVGGRRREENVWFSVGETENEGVENKDKIGVVSVTSTVAEKSDVLMLSTRDLV